MQLHGKWTVTARTYAEETRRLAERLGRLQWAVIQDWMCDPAILARTRRSVRVHQRRTIDSWFALNRLAPDVNWMPVLQGQTADDYEAHAEAYDEAGVRLAALPVVGLGSVALRQCDPEVLGAVERLKVAKLRLHGFGMKVRGLERLGTRLASADSLAWSYQARKRPPLLGCTHRRCNNCLQYARRWRQQILRVLTRHAPS